MIEIIHYIEKHWVLFTFLVSCIISFTIYLINVLKAIKCCLRNDILTIYDRCKDKQEITKYELSAIESTAHTYFLLRGNSFVKELMNDIRSFKVI